jgi:di/tricarboxylate transporter
MDYHTMSVEQQSSCRKSGLLLACGAALLYLVLWMRGKQHPYVAVAAVVLAVTALFEAWPLRKSIELLTSFGNFMHRFTNPLIFGLIYIIAVIPTSLLLRLLGKDVLLRNYDSCATSYWVDRPDGKAWNGSFRNQF